ncbi:MAG: TIGR00269 family protein [Candidatus Woesearchaeota archaeon]|jgi:uncharacterized protein (TIGR00269 family)
MDLNIEQQVRQTLSKIKLNKKDKIIVALSGGKDSSVMAYLLKKLGYNIEGFYIDLKMGGYSEDCFNAVKKLCNNLKIKLHVYDIRKEMGNSMCNIRQSIQSKSKNTIKNCAICGVIKKWILNKEARRLKAKYIATGHHLDDEIQTFLLNILKGSPELSLNNGIITKNISDKKFIPRLKPLFYILEKDIKEYSIKNKLPVVYEKCPCAIDSYRIQIREFMKTLNDKQKKNIMKNSEQISQKLKKESTKIKYCEICGEPSRNKICKMCELLRK